MKTIIEINGRKYDARTGELLSNNSAEQQLRNADIPAVQSQPQKAGVALDGVNRRKVQTPQNLQPKQVASEVVITKKTKQISAGAKSLDIKPLRHKAQRAQTLLRAAVVKPQKSAPHIHSTSTISQSKVERSATGRGLLMKRIPDSRLSRAKQATKSLYVNKFNAVNLSRKPRLTNDMVVAPAPKTVEASIAMAPVLTKPVLGNPEEKQQVFNHSIAHATHHNAAKVKKPHVFKRIANNINISPRIAAAVAGVFAVIILGGFLAYQNIPSVAMRVAASKAGFSGSIPSNTPAGFSFKGPIRFSKGNIALRYNSSSDDRSFVISQKPTDWTSESLLTNHIVATKTRYQTYHDKGLTVFIYNDGNATWVNKGVWYNIVGKGSLSSDQILSIASSM